VNIASDWIEFICAERLLDEPTDWVCPCGGGIVKRTDENDMYCWQCYTQYELVDDL